MKEPADNPGSKRAAVIHAAPADASRASDEAVRRAQTLIHELAGLIDGSLRLIDLARHAIASPETNDAEPTDALRHLESAHAAMSHIAALVRSAYRPSPRDIHAGVLAAHNTPISLASAINSAADALLPRARSHGIQIILDADATTRGVPADEIYAVVSNAIRNSIESIGQSGRIEVRARVDSGRVNLEILDDGVGPPADAARAFELGFSTKPGSSGVGLALAAEVITELQGTIELLPRGLPEPNRPGAILRATYPIPAHRKAANTI